MKLAFEGSGFCIEFKENRIEQLIIEHPVCFRSVLSEIIRQSEGKDGKLILSDSDKILDFSKKTTLIYNLFDLDSSSRKLTNRLYEMLNQRMMESELYLRYQSILANAEMFMNDLEGMSDYALQYDSDVAIAEFLKLLGVKIAEEDQTLLERLSDYLKLSVDLLGSELIILVNFRSYFAKEEALQLYEMINYCKIPVLLLENSEREMIEYEHRYIIDSDLCII